MFETNLISAIINNNHMLIERRASYTRCFYQLESGELGAVLIKELGVVYSYRTCDVPSTLITKALINYCIERVNRMR